MCFGVQAAQHGCLLVHAFSSPFFSVVKAKASLNVESLSYI